MQDNRAAIPEAMPIHNDNPRAVDIVKRDLRNLPVLSGSIKLIDSICADLDARAEAGFKKYNTYLQPFNNRDQLMDAYQEILDCVKYLACHLYETPGCEYEYKLLLTMVVNIGAKIHG